MAETTLYLVRHAESEANAAGRFAGQLDSPLTTRGREQAEAVAEFLSKARFDRVIASDLSRARDTAAAIAKRQHLAVETVTDLREIDVGDAEGRPFTDLRQRPDWTPDGFVQWPGGESLDQAYARARRAIDRIVAESPGATVCIVGHGGIARILVSHFMGLLPKLYRHPRPTTNTDLTIVRTDGTTYRIEALFDDAHVARPPSPEEQALAPAVPDARDAI
jgi:broad specificity phosphatase PhoE